MSVNEDISRPAGTYGDVLTGTDGFSYMADDGAVDSSLATVYFTITAISAQRFTNSAKKLLARLMWRVVFRIGLEYNSSC